jgi:hypothetical protein
MSSFYGFEDNFLTRFMSYQNGVKISEFIQFQFQEDGEAANNPTIKVNYCFRNLFKCVCKYVLEREEARVT